MKGEEEVANECKEYLVFSLGHENYAIDILKVQEIRSYEVVTTIPNAPAYVKGVINLRGDIVPIYDLRIRFHLEQVDYSPVTTVIVLAVHRRIIGVVVDGVSNVISLTPEQIRPAPDFAATFDTAYILGMAQIDDITCIVADIEALMADPEPVA